MAAEGETVTEELETFDCNLGDQAESNDVHLF